MDLFNYHRRESSVVHIGALDMGGDNPVRIQSMTTTSTDDTEGSVAQAERIIKAGGELERLTTQGVKEAENLKNINAGNYVAACEAYLNLDSRRAAGKDCKDPLNRCRGVWLRAQDRHKRCMEAQ